MKPELCRSETMALCTAEAERLFVRLWTQCDDEGRAVDNVKLLKGDLFPLHDEVTAEDIDRLLWDLSELGLIARYEVDGKRYLEVTSWGEHQHPQKPRPSGLPQRARASDLRKRPEYDRATVGVPYESSPVGVVVVGVVDVEVLKNSCAKSDATPTNDEPAPAVPKPADIAFDRFWAAYPLKKGKKPARDKWDRAIKAGHDPEAIIAGASAYAVEMSQPDSMVKFPEGWLSAERWNDEPAPPRGPTTKVGRNRAAIVSGAEATLNGGLTFAERLAAAGDSLQIESGNP